DPLLAVQAVAAAVRSRRQAGQPTHLAPIAELPPSEKLHHEQPRAVDPDGPQQQQLTDLDLGPTGGLHHPLAPLRLQPLDLRLHELQTLQLPLETSSQIRRQRTAVPQPDRLESPTNPATARAHRHSLRRQKPPDPVAMLRPLLLQRLQLPAQLTTVFLRHARHPHHAPHLLLPRVVPQQQAQQLDPIQLVRLRPPLPTIHLDTRGVHHLILHTHRHQEPVQPESIPTRLVATQHPGRLRKTKPLLGATNLLTKRQQVSSLDRPQPGLLTHLRREGQLPLAPPQLQREIQSSLLSRTLLLAGRLAHLVHLGNSPFDK